MLACYFNEEFNWLKLKIKLKMPSIVFLQVLPNMAENHEINESDSKKLIDPSFCVCSIMISEISFAKRIVIFFKKLNCHHCEHYIDHQLSFACLK
jgi:hypothetical protein